MTTDPQVLGTLAWAATVITILGFAFTIWQLVRTKRSADAAREAALGLVQRVHSRELLAKLGEAHTRLEAARNHFAGGDREIALLCLELSSGLVIEAQEIARRLPGTGLGFGPGLRLSLAESIEDITMMAEPLTGHPEFVRLRLKLKDASEILLTGIAQSRYTYDLNEE